VFLSKLNTYIHTYIYTYIHTYIHTSSVLVLDKFANYIYRGPRRFSSSVLLQTPIVSEKNDIEGGLVLTPIVVVFIPPVIKHLSLLLCTFRVAHVNLCLNCREYRKHDPYSHPLRRLQCLNPFAPLRLFCCKIRLLHQINKQSLDRIQLSSYLQSTWLEQLIRKRNCICFPIQ